MAILMNRNDPGSREAAIAGVFAANILTASLVLRDWGNQCMFPNLILFVLFDCFHKNNEVVQESLVMKCKMSHCQIHTTGPPLMNV